VVPVETLGIQAQPFPGFQGPLVLRRKTPGGQFRLSVKERRFAVNVGDKGARGSAYQAKTERACLGLDVFSLNHACSTSRQEYLWGY
jgi:hypothetical protein